MLTRDLEKARKAYVKKTLKRPKWLLISFQRKTMKNPIKNRENISRV